MHIYNCVFVLRNGDNSLCITIHKDASWGRNTGIRANAPAHGETARSDSAPLLFCATYTVQIPGQPTGRLSFARITWFGFCAHIASHENTSSMERHFFAVPNTNTTVGDGVQVAMRAYPHRAKTRLGTCWNYSRSGLQAAARAHPLMAKPLAQTPHRCRFCVKCRVQILMQTSNLFSFGRTTCFILCTVPHEENSVQRQHLLHCHTRTRQLGDGTQTGPCTHPHMAKPPLGKPRLGIGWD
jgi:hypothetical protein